jgi:hypothetical protein
MSRNPFGGRIITIINNIIHCAGCFLLTMLYIHCCARIFFDLLTSLHGASPVFIIIGVLAQSDACQLHQLAVILASLFVATWFCALLLLTKFMTFTSWQQRLRWILRITSGICFIIYVAWPPLSYFYAARFKVLSCDFATRLWTFFITRGTVTSDICVRVRYQSRPRCDCACSRLRVTSYAWLCWSWTTTRHSCVIRGVPTWRNTILVEYFYLRRDSSK